MLFYICGTVICLILTGLLVLAVYLTNDNF